MHAATAETPSDPDTFLVCGLPYLIVTRPQIRAGEALPAAVPPAAALATMRTAAPAPGDPAAFVPLFTDADLAARFLAACDPSGAVFAVTRPGSAGAFAVLLAELARQRAWVGFDPRPNTGRHVLYPAATVLGAIVDAVSAQAEPTSD